MPTACRPLSFLTSLFSTLSGARSAGFAGFRGYSAPLDLKPGQRAWVPWIEPGSGLGSLALCHFAGGQGSNPRFLASDGETTRDIPSAFVRPAEPSLALKVGSAVLAPRPGGCAYGRVSALALETVRVDFVQGLDGQSRQYHRSHLIPLTGSQHFGAPVAYSEGGLWRWGQWFGAARGSHWLLTREGAPRELAADLVRPLSQDRLLPGERAVAVDGPGLEKARVIRILDSGLSYLLRFEGSGEVAIRDYALVGAPL